MERRQFLKVAGVSGAALGLPGSLARAQSSSPQRPNILWIVVEDISAHLGCYGSDAVPTPNIDRLASQGALFTNCYVTEPVCSPSRSALITGMYQMAIGSHHHRSSFPGSEIHLPRPIRPLPKILQENGYFTCNGGPKSGQIQTEGGRLGKTDYNFAWDPKVYNGADWLRRKPGQPFFAQIQLNGGKSRNVRVKNPVDPATVKLPPYYPDDPVVRTDWAKYLNSIIYLDEEVGEILQRLEDEGIAHNTIVAFWSDHGVSHVRGKQFCYDEGTHTPLVIRWPGVIRPGTVRHDLVQQIDLTASTLYMAGVPVPGYMQGRNLFGPDFKPRRFILSGRDRCDETFDSIRAIRTDQYLYLRNFLPERPYLQPNRYKDGKEVVQRMRQLHAEGKLNPTQAAMFAQTRPLEELYDVVKDPHQIHNLANAPEHRGTLVSMRRVLIDRMREIKDLGLIPEFELVKLNKKYGGAYDILRRPERAGLLDDILHVIALKENGTVDAAGELATALQDERPSIRWWAARGLGKPGPAARTRIGNLTAALSDPEGGVRVEAARSLLLLGQASQGLPVLRAELANKDQIVRHYAALALEDIGPESSAPSLPDIKTALAREGQYEYVNRLCVRLIDTIEAFQKTA